MIFAYPKNDHFWRLLASQLDDEQKSPKKLLIFGSISLENHRGNGQKW